MKFVYAILIIVLVNNSYSLRREKDQKGVWDSIKNAGTAVANTATKFATSAADAVQKGANSLKDGVLGLAEGKVCWNKTPEFSSGPKKCAAGLKCDYLAPPLPTETDKPRFCVKDTAVPEKKGGFFSGLKDKATGAFNKAKDLAKSAATSVGNMATNAVNTVKDSKFGKAVASGVNQATNAVAGAVNSASNAVTGAVNNIRGNNAQTCWEPTPAFSTGEKPCPTGLICKNPPGTPAGGVKKCLPA